jgi:hypothetical protein
VPVQEELEAGAVARHDDALVRGRLRDDDLVRVLVFLGDRREAVREDERGDEDRPGRDGADVEARRVPDVVPEEVEGPERDRDVQEAESDPR